MIDSHCHLTCDQLNDSADELIQHAVDAGFSKLMIMCTSKEELERAQALKKQYPDLLLVAFGWFPSDALQVTESDLAYLEDLAKSNAIDVLGEIGLDYYWDTSFKDEQKALFEKQIKIANKAGLPIAIHMREASRDTLDLLEEFAKTPIIFHCFSGSTEIMKEALKLNSLISFAGPITYKNNKTGPANVIACPMERILVETDSPYLSPVPYRGKPNEPAYAVKTLEKICDLKGISYQKASEAVDHNFARLFEPGVQFIKA